jgi:DNA-directed RNA polymerase specialized sigma24 family protein
MVITEDCELLKLVQAGDRAALVFLYDRHSSVVHPGALRILKSPESAEDVQELFLQLWHRPDGVHVEWEQCGDTIPVCRRDMLHF